MTKVIERRKNNLYKTFIDILFVVSMFIIAGTLIPPFIVFFTPASQYLVIDSPATTDKKEYRAGEYTILNALRTSNVLGTGMSVQELVLINKEGERIDVFHNSFPIPLSIGDRDDGIRLKLPDDIETGSYFWHGILSFEVSGVQKHVPYNSVTFDIIK